tara:strand:+ start:663 stop:953 length:291 start_codon:yes stop_codon:yes gene_type:complete
MKKYIIICSIISLILATALIKNSTKKIEDQIFTKRENLRSLKKDFENIKLEYEYLSSAEKLMELHDLYFDEGLIQKKFEEIIIINKDLEIQKIKIN